MLNFDLIEIIYQDASFLIQKGIDGMDHDQRVSFLAAWKKAVIIIGEEYFENNGKYAEISHTHDAIDKDQIRPDADKFRGKMSYASTSEKLFMAAIYTFFNDTDGQEMFEEFSSGSLSIGSIANRLDQEQKIIFSDLLLNHQGW